MADDKSKTALVNRALGFLGERRITSTDNPQTPAGKHIVDNYDPCRREVLERFPWPFAEKWGTLNYVQAAPKGFDFSDLYAIPADYIRPVNFPGLGVPSTLSTLSADCIVDYRIINIGTQVCIALNNNANPELNIAYISDVTLLNLWSPLALKVFADFLALDAAKAITGMDDLVSKLNAMLTLDLQDAVGVAGNSQPKHRSAFSNVGRERQAVFMGGPGFFTNVAGYPTY